MKPKSGAVKMRNTKRHQQQPHALRLGDMLKVVLPPDEQLLGEMMLAKSIGMLAGPRGSGKSWLALLIGYAIACSKTLPPWGTGAGVPVAILDGEMRAAGLQDRIALIHAYNTNQKSIKDAENNLHIISRDFMGDAIGSIDTEEGQKSINDLIEPEVKLIIIDNLSAWTSGGREDSNSWAKVKNWLIKMRLQGVAILLIHHTGKNGQQRGSSSHEDLLDYSILLSPLPSSQNRQDTRFSIEHTKLRDYIPELRQIFEYSIWSEDGAFRFDGAPAGIKLSVNEADMLRLREEGLSLEAIATKLGINKSTVSRCLKKLRNSSQDNDLIE
ncbi:AAA family ATPase [Undibacterium sp. Ji22W]|uniref:AAA family ATPase n=1 Tax=Undibacterium sp. Ji22W TaxID=3413038 RepID=UPI003BF1D5E0